MATPQRDKKMKLLVIEQTDQDRFGIDTVLMTVPDEYSKAQVDEDSGLESPKIVDETELDENKFSTLYNLGFYRPFFG